MITFACPTCSQSYTVADDKAGKTAKCKKCGAPVTVPAPPGSDRAPKAPRPLELPDREEERPARPRPPLRVVAALAGASILAVAAIGAVAVYVSQREPKGDESARGQPPAKPPAADPAEQAKQSFGAVAERVRVKLGALKPERQPSFIRYDLPDAGTDLAVDAELSFNPVFSVTEDVEATRSLTTPYRGTVKFAVKMEGAMKGVQRGERAKLPFAFDYWSDQKVEAVYLFRERAWSLSEVKVTTTNFGAKVPGDKDASVFAQLLAGEVNKSKDRFVGRSVTFQPSEDVTLVRLLREAAN